MTEAETDETLRTQRQAWRGPRIALAVLLGLAAVGVMLFGLMFGHCATFGGTCPAREQPLWDNDAARFVGSGAALLVVAILVGGWPDRRGWAVGLLSAAVVGLALTALVSASASY